MVREQDYAGFAIDPATGQRHELRHLPKDTDWQEEIYMIEPKDKILGGLDGLMNLPIQELANRTEYLKKEIEEKGGTGAFTTDISIPATGWKEMTGADYPYYIDIPHEKITADMIPMLTILPNSIGDASAFGICPACETVAGAVRVFTKTVPDNAIAASLALFTPKGGGGIAELPIATESALGAVKIGEGLSVNSEGLLSVNKETVMTADDLVNEEEAKEDIARILRR